MNNINTKLNLINNYYHDLLNIKQAQKQDASKLIYGMVNLKTGFKHLSKKPITPIKKHGQFNVFFKLN
jgi:uncharacterized protein YfkK (UPF0435 family)